MMKLIFSYIDAGVHPKLGRVFHWRKRAEDGSDVPRYTKYICEVLSAVAQDVDSCDRLLRFIEKIELGEESVVETGGNDVTLTMSLAGVQVDIEVFEEYVGQAEGRFKLSEWKNALQGWRRFLQMPKTLGSVVEVTL